MNWRKLKSGIYYTSITLATVYAVGMGIYDVRHPWRCVETHEVTQILSVQDRNFVVKIETGEETIINKTNLRVGETVCFRHERKE